MKDILAGKPEEKIIFKPRVYECVRSRLPFGRPDGKLDKPFWEQAEFSEDFEDILWNENAARPAHRTRMKMLYDSEALYVGALLEESMIWATLTERDCVIFNDNDFEIFIDPDGDTHNYCEFEMNALNTVWDLLLTKPYRDSGMRVVNGWDIHGLESAVYVDGRLNDPTADNRFWSVEIKLPFAALKEFAKDNKAPAAGDCWRIDFSRVEWRTELKDGKYSKVINPETGRPYPEDNWIWSPIGRVDMHMPELWGFLHFQDENKLLSPYTLTPADRLKWQLRRLYYREKYYYAEHGVYSDDYALLCGGKAETEAKISVTPHTYEASAVTECGKTLTIFSDGLIKEL